MSKPETKKINWKEVLLNGLLPMVISIFPVLFLYGQNALEVSISEVFPILVVFLGCSIAVYLLTALVVRNPAKSALISSILLGIFLNYSIFEKGLSFLPIAEKYWEKAFIICFILLHLVAAVLIFCKQELSKTLTFVFTLCIGGLCLVNVIMAVPHTMENIWATNELKSHPMIQAEGVDTSRPNIYYFIFDEMGGFPAMKDFYGYDGTADIQHFKDLGFNVSEYSFAGTGNTYIETGNLFNLDYVVDWENSSVEQDASRKNAKAFDILDKHGYFVLGIGSNTKTEYDLQMAYDVASGGKTTEDGRDFKTIVLENTVCNQFLNLNRDMFADYREEMLTSIQYLKDPLHYAEGGQFYLLHVNAPHMPFVFNEEGEALKPGIAANWVDKSLYLGQYKYMLQHIRELTKSIVTNDPNSIVVVQSDHGFRGGGQISDQLEPFHCYNIVNMVYYKGQPLDIDKKTSINTLRTIFNAEFGTDYEMLTPPEGMYQYEE